MQHLSTRYKEYYEKIQKAANNKRGFTTEYRYKREFYGWDEQPEALKVRRMMYIGIELIGTLIFIMAAIQHVEYNTIKLSSGFAITSIVPWLAEVIGVVRFAVTKSPMIIPDYNEIKDCITFGSLIRCLLLVLSFGFGTYFLVSGGQMSAGNALVAAGHLASAAASFFLFRSQTSLKCRIYSNVGGKPVID